MFVRPKIAIRYNSLDWTLEIVSISCYVFLIIMLVIYYPDLPKSVPTHYNAAGVPDGFGSKTSIIILPVIGVFVYALLTFAQRVPHLFNFPVPLNEQNYRRQYDNALLMMKILKLIITVQFLYITLVTIETGLGHMKGLGSFFVPIFLVLILGTVGVFLVRTFKLK
jgi:uncharacterized membrane protein